jgi:hypothetical protein
MIKSGALCCAVLASAVSLLTAPAAGAKECPPCGPRFCLGDPGYTAALGEAKAELLARGYPERLVALLSKIPPCIGCLDSSPRAFHLQIDFGKRRKEISTLWTAELEVSAREQLAKGKIAGFYIYNAAQACACCDGKEGRKRADWDQEHEFNTDQVLAFTDPKTMGKPPDDLKQPRRKPPRKKEGTPPKVEPRPVKPTPRAHDVCAACKEEFDLYNSAAEDVDSAQRAIADMEVNYATESFHCREAIDEIIAEGGRRKGDPNVPSRCRHAEDIFQRMQAKSKELGATRERLAAKQKLLAICNNNKCKGRLDAQPPQRPPAPPPPPSDEGRLRLGLGLGPLIGLKNTDHQLGLSLVQASWALLRRQLWLAFSLGLGVLGGSTTLLLPVGVEYVYPIRQLPGLSIFGRLSLGYGMQRISSDTAPGFPGMDFTNHFGIFVPEAGVRYRLSPLGGRLYLGFDPISIPVLFNGDGSGVIYRMLFLVGLTLL